MFKLSMIINLCLWTEVTGKCELIYFNDFEPQNVTVTKTELSFLRV